MTVTKRRTLVEERVQTLGSVDYSSLADEFGVSEMTIRRDIDFLEAKGVVRRITGGAIAVSEKINEPSFQSRLVKASIGKAHIAAKVVEMIGEGETVVLDGGSTVLAVARAMRGKDLRLTVITASLLIAMELADEPDTTIILAGGLVRPGELSTIGPDAQAAFSRYNADVFVMGVAGVHPERGVSDYHPSEAAVKAAAIAASDRVIVAIDRSKLGKVTLMNVAPISAVDEVVCDADDDDETVMEMRHLGITVRCVSDSEATR